MSRGRRIDESPKLNIKKVVATFLAFVVVIMFVISIKKLLTGTPKTKEVSIAETYFSVYKDEKWGVIDNTGKEVVAPTYDEMVVVPDKNKDLFICVNNAEYESNTYSTKVINKEGKEILNAYQNVQALENSDSSNVWYESDILKFQKDGKYGLIDFSGKLILDAEYDSIYTLNGIAKNVIIEKEGKKGLVNTSMGEIIIEPVYDEITTLTDSYENGYIVKKDGKCGIISADSKVIFEPQYDEIKNVTSDGYYAVVQSGKLNLINSAGEIKIDSKMDDVKEINGENITIISNNLYGVVDINGNSVIEPQYEDLKYIFGTNYIAKKNGKYGVISTSGVTELDFNYTSMEYIKRADFIQAENENFSTDIIDRDFKVALKDVIISELNLEDGYIRVREKDDYNYYNFKFEKKTNKDVLATNTLFLYKENGKYGYENKNGDRIVDPIYDDAKEQNKYGYCAVKKDGVWGCLKSDGTIVVKPSVNLDEYFYIDFVADWYLNKDIDLNVYTK